MEKKTNHIEIDGFSYIPVKDAALITEYTADYVGQLCRGGKVEATKIGRAWYVSEESILAHKESKSETKDVEELVEDEVEIHTNIRKEVELEKNRRRLTAKTIFTDSSFIVYSKDDSPLIPVLNSDISEDTCETSPIRDAKKDAEPAGEILQIPYERPKLLLPNFAKIFAPLLGFASFAIVFLLLFSLNGSYTGDLIGNSFNNAVATVASTEAGATIERDVLDPFRVSAIKFSEYVDEKVLQTIYGEEIYEEIYKR